MNDLIGLIQIGAAIGMLVGPPIVIARLLSGPDDGDLASLLAFRTDLPWPPGVQEEDPPAWRLDKLGARARGDVPVRDLPPNPSPCAPETRPAPNLRLGARP